MSKARKIRNIVIVTALVAAAWPLVWPDQAQAVFSRVENTVMDAYFVRYFDRATWSTGCY